MLIEEIISPATFVKEWTFIRLWNIWLLLLVKISSKFSTIITRLLWDSGIPTSMSRGLQLLTECLGQALVFMWNTRPRERFISIFQGISWGWGGLSGRILRFSWYFLHSEDPESYATCQLVEQLVYTSLLLTTKLRFTCGETKICSTIKMSQNIMKMIVGQP